MKIGLVSDIHADLTAFQKALALLQSHQPDKIICVGDAVESGVQGCVEVFKLLHENNIPCVMGNHEQYTVGHQAWLRKNKPDQLSRLLPDDLIEYLQNLPEILRYDWEGLRVVISHGTLWTLFPHSKPHFFPRICEMARADVLILGHTHVPMHARSGSTHIFNPGAVTHQTEEQRCALLSLPDLAFTLLDVDTGKVVPCEMIEP